MKKHSNEISLKYHVDVFSVKGEDENELLDTLDNRFYFSVDEHNLEKAKEMLLESVAVLQDKIARLTLL